uniref:Uncharacterized protein n=1 Tax=Chromera velia CCMP2878 TaxID=1169474 RepID=A0A0G4HBD4_9ALVE|eukprot:Cvel_912.t1-p1 / transcript=Cvel_912.t1 / gene=Cvel_912 / organism=Chromera_velia_CCMP2878 / gene_product=Alpha-glucan water dikinase, chloroplastic, putative / transcript_product=Alpha-glucan water dikinase, chloroplastic, putative / location=Cvel_scaffold29:6509-18448(+) / protein_length=1597 / sequence_SO=supercontig / SO=protein_coding / is_pseudo=false
MESSFSLGGTRRVTICPSVSADRAKVDVLISASGFDGKVILHWGYGVKKPQEWIVPPEDLLPPNSSIVPGAAQTEFIQEPKTEKKTVKLSFDMKTHPVAGLQFVVHQPPGGWFKCGNGNFLVDIQFFLEELKRNERVANIFGASVEEVKKTVGCEQDLQRRWQLERGHSLPPLSLESLVFSLPKEVVLFFLCDGGDAFKETGLLLHWGLAAGRSGQWRRVDVGTLQSEGQTFPFDEKAVQTHFAPWKGADSGLLYAKLVLPGALAAASEGGLMFVLKESKKPISQGWLKNGQADFELEIPHRDEWHQERKAWLAQEEEERRKKVARAEARAVRFQGERAARESAADLAFKTFEVGGDNGQLDISVRRKKGAQSEGEACPVEVVIVGDFPKSEDPLVMHWGILGLKGNRLGSQWTCPPEWVRPGGTTVADPKKACQTPFSMTSLPPRSPRDGEPLPLQSLVISLSPPKDAKLLEETADERDRDVSWLASAGLGGLSFVLTNSSRTMWYKEKKGGGDFTIRVCTSSAPPPAGSECLGVHAEVVGKIVEAEVDYGAWTLMHRYNLCHDMCSEWQAEQDSDDTQPLNRVRSWVSVFQTGVPQRAKKQASFSSVVLPQPAREQQGRDFWAWMFVWQRFSFMRLLDWQRNYNTQPRILAGATDRVTFKLADLWKQNVQYRPLIRLVLSTMGRGGNNGQRIRDEILHIMHRNHIPETRGHFYEEWHQKLHNNTTPDDVGICRALIAFLRSHGDMGVYWRVLEEHGIDRQRLESYDRAVRSEPYMHGDAGRLVWEFENYLKILQSVHDSTDLKTAIDHARGALGCFGDGHRVMNMLDDVMGRLGGNTATGVKSLGQMGRGGRRRSASFGSLTHVHHSELDHKHHIFMLIAECRRSLLLRLNDKSVPSDQIRELLLLDFALEQQQSVILMGVRENRSWQLTEQLMALLMSLSGHSPADSELRCLYSDFLSLGQQTAGLNWQADGSHSGEEAARESALMLKSLTERATRAVGSLTDEFQSLLHPRAKYLGEQVSAPKEVLEVFVDEVLRGTSLFGIAQCLKALEPQLREIAHLPPWQIISPGNKDPASMQGRLIVIRELSGMQDDVFEEPTVIVAGAVNGEEEVPVGVFAVLVSKPERSPDILAHVSVRARNSKVLLATCFDAKLIEQVSSSLQNKWVEVMASADFSSVNIRELSGPPGEGKGKGGKGKGAKGAGGGEAEVSEEKEKEMAAESLKIDMDRIPKEWCVAVKEFSPAVVGSKSLNISNLATLLPKEVLTPRACALPFDVLWKVMASEENLVSVRSRLENTLMGLQRISQQNSKATNQKAHFVFEEARHLVRNMEMPDELMDALRQSLRGAGERNAGLGDSQTVQMTLEDLLEEGGGEGAAGDAIKDVWASLFGMRPWVSLRKAQRKYADLKMAVLCQELMEASYAFVLHTENPFDEAKKNELFGELVVGLGETLVGSYPGRALSWGCERAGPKGSSKGASSVEGIEVKAPKVTSFFSKSTALICNKPCLIFRSDSNGEDLEGFAGAGLFESVTAVPPSERRLRYHRHRIIYDRAYRQHILALITKVGFFIEDALGSPQDIEGVVIGNDQIAIVQTRPQV